MAAFQQPEPLPPCPPYHPNSELRTRNGYYPNLSHSQIEAAKTVTRMIHNEQLHFNDTDELEYLKVLRFLRARNFDVNKTMEMIRADIKWRSERPNLRQQNIAEVLNCDIAAFRRYLPTWTQGFDKQCRPVIYRKFGFYEVWNVQKLTTMDRMIGFDAWEASQLERIMGQKSRETGCNIETFVAVTDAASWHLGLATRDAYTFIQGMANAASNHFPERLGCCIIINAPMIFTAAWAIIQTFLDPIQKEKIKLYGTNPAKWRPVLFSLIDEDQVPMQYGGKAPNLPPEVEWHTLDPPRVIAPPPQLQPHTEQELHDAKVQAQAPSPPQQSQPYAGDYTMATAVVTSTAATTTAAAPAGGAHIAATSVEGNTGAAPPSHAAAVKT